MKRTALLLLLLPFAALAGELYKWVDKNGNVHYSDTPVEGAEAIELKSPNTFQSPDVTPRAPRPTESAAPQAFRYAEFQFVSPKQDQVFWATGGEIPVQLSSKPGLQERHRVNLYYNGELLDGSPMQSLGTTLTGVFRGAHTVRAVIVDAAGNELAAAGPVTFHVKQRSLANPQNPPPNRPRPPRQ